MKAILEFDLRTDDEDYRRARDGHKAFYVLKDPRLIYKRSKKNANPVGLGFPDNFMAVMGWKRVTPP